MPYKNVEDRRKSSQRHYNKHPEWYKERNDRRKAEYTRIIREAKDKPCMDCGVRYPHYVMDFDHRDSADKKFNIGMLNKIPSVKGLLAEIAKCDVVCSNCHRERTWNSMPVGGNGNPSDSESEDSRFES